MNLAQALSPPAHFLRRRYRYMRKKSGKRLYPKVLRGNEKAQQAFREIGTDVQKKVQKRIDEGQFVPNAPSTIKRKGHDHPLIDTGTMRDSISYTICEKGKYD